MASAHVFHHPRPDSDPSSVGSPTLDKRVSAGLQGSESLDSPGVYKALKCRCRKSWCPSCSKHTVIKAFREHVTSWDWRCVRLLTLTIDRQQFETPEQAYDFISKKKSIPLLFHDLNRTCKAGVVDWVKMTEWHKDGFPHWHILVLVDKPGRAGMLGADNVRHYWKFGSIKEGFIRDEHHWKRFNGYFEKMGYFEDKKGKAHQVTLPEWARNRTTPIRRMSRRVRLKDMEYVKPTEKPIHELTPEEQQKRQDQNLNGLASWFEKMGALEGKRLVTEGEKLDHCGDMVEIYAGRGWGDFVCTLEIPYGEFIREVKGAYVPGQGYVFSLQDNLEYFPSKIVIGG